MNWTKQGIWSSAAVIATVMTIGSEARAQAGASVLTGRVVDASTKAPAVDVVVTVTSPSLQGEETVVTDGSGTFRVQNLPPGNYTIRMDKETYRPYSRAGIELRSDVTLRVDAELLPEALKEEIVVVAAPPTVDVGSSNTGLNISGDFVKRVPVIRPGALGGAVRSFEAAAAATPQAAGDTYGTSINGTTSPENQYVIDGLSRNNAGFGTNGARLSMEFVREVNVQTGGYLPEYGAAGGGNISAVTKTGSNEFKTGAWLFVSPGFLEGERRRVYRTGQTVATQQSLSMIGDLGAEVGGPIIKDKLWFYAGFLFARQAVNMDRSLYGAQSGELPGTQRRYLALREDAQLFVKLTYSADKQNRFSYTFYALPSTSGGSDRIGIDPLAGGPVVGNITGPVDALSNMVVTNTISNQLEWDTESASKKALLKTTVGWMHQTEGTRANDGTQVGDPYGLAAVPGVSWRRNTPGPHGIGDFEPVAPWQCDAAGVRDAKLCPVTSYFTGGPGFLTERTFDRFQGRSVLTLLGELAGHHIIKFGVEGDFNRYNSVRGYSGKGFIRESVSGASFADNRGYSYLTGPDQRVLLDKLNWTTHSLMVGGFAQNSWSIMDKFTLQGGIRYDAQLLWGGDGNVSIALPNQISPRVGLIWDPTQKGHSKVFGNYSRYYQSVALNIADRAGSSEPQANGTRRATTCNPLDRAQLQGVCQDPSTYVTGGSAETPDKKYTIVGAGKTPIDQDLKPQYSEELVFGGEYDVIKNGRLGLTYTKRWVGRIIEDISRDEAQTYYITNPGERSTRDFPQPQRNYDALTAYLTKTFSDSWEAQLSYTLSYLRGNYVGLFRPETGQLDPMTNADFDLKSLTVNRTGPLPGDSRHVVKLFGSKTFDTSEHTYVSLGGAARATSGGPTSYLGSHPIYGADEIFILPRGEGNRLPWIYSLDSNISFGVKLANQQTVSISMDIFNLLNFQEIAGRDERYTTSDVQPLVGARREDLGNLRGVDGELLQKRQVNPNFGNPNAFQAPRQFRIGVRANF